MSTYCNYWNKVSLVKSKIKQSKKIDSIGIGLASPEEIRRWGERRLPNGTLIGKVDKDHTVDYESLKPIEGGLFCERIFGPVEDFYCSCDRKGEKNEKFCPNCEVEFTKSRVRRVRMGYIPLAVPVVHVWYLRGRPSYIANLVGKNRNSIDRLAYGETLCESFIGFSSLKSLDKKEGFNNISFGNICSANIEAVKETEGLLTKSIEFAKGFITSNEPLCSSSFTSYPNISNICYASQAQDVTPLGNASLTSYRFRRNPMLRKDKMLAKQGQDVSFVSLAQGEPAPHKMLTKQSVGVNAHIVKPDDRLLQNVASRVKQTGSISLMLSQKFPTSPALSVTYQPTSNSLCCSYSFANIFDVKQSLIRKAKKGYTKKGYSYPSPTRVSTASFNELASYSLPRYLKLRRDLTSYEVLHFFRQKASKEEVSTMRSKGEPERVPYQKPINSVMVRISKKSKLRSSFILLPIASLTSFTSYPKEMLVRSKKGEPAPYKMLMGSNKVESAPYQKPPNYLSASFDREPFSKTWAPPLLRKTSPLQAPSKLMGSRLPLLAEGLEGLQKIRSNRPITSNNGFLLASLTSCSNEMLMQSKKQMLMRSKKELLGRSNKGELALYQNQIFEQKQKYLKFHTLPLFSTFVYKEWSHRFSFLEYFIWSARNNDLVLPFYTYQNSRSEESRANLCESIRKNSLNLIKNKFFLRFSNKSNLSLNATAHIPSLRSKDNISTLLGNICYASLTSPSDKMLAKQAQHVSASETKLTSFPSDTKQMLGQDVSKPYQSYHFVPSGNIFDISTASQPSYNPLQGGHWWAGLRKASTLPLITNRFSLRSKGTTNGVSEVGRNTYLNYYNPLTNRKVSTVSPFWAFTGPIPSPFTESIDVVNKSLVSRKQLKGFALPGKQSTKMDTQQFPRLTELLNFTGGAALRSLLSRFDLVVLSKFLRHELKNLELKVNNLLALKMLTYSQGLLLGKLAKRRSKQIRRLKLLELFQSQKSNPEWMILSVIPVLPPDLRPILRVNDDFVVASDLNRLYQTVLRRNNTIHERLDDPLPCPESGLFRQRSLQKAVDGLLENGKGGGTPLCASKRRPLVSLSHVLKGKKGLFRQHLLGKRVDYSGRSVIVVGPRLQLHECGLPKEMAIELFQPFLLHRLKVKGMATSNTAARRMIQQGDPVIWHILKQLVYEHPVLLNRAPTLHRLGIQAFQPRLVSGRAILLHPLVCNGFNADFDGDQMAVHVPLSFQARAEAWKIMWSKNNFLSPATGQPILVPSQDMVLGCYYLSVSIPRILNANVIPPASDLKDLSLCSDRGTQKKEGFANIFSLLNIEDVSKGFIEPAYGVDKFLVTPGEVKESVINITCNRPSQRQNTFLNENKGRYFSNLQDSLLAYFQGRLQTHTPFWVRIDPISFHPITPLLTKNVQLRTKFSLTTSKFTCGPKPQLCKTLYSRFAYRAKLEEAFTITSTSASVLQPLYGSSREMCKTFFQNKSANHYQTRIEANETLESPLELRLSVDGNLANILTMFQNHYNYNATWVKQCKEESIKYMRTTAGRVVINEAVFKDF